MTLVSKGSGHKWSEPETPDTVFTWIEVPVGVIYTYITYIYLYDNHSWIHLYTSYISHCHVHKRHMLKICREALSTTRAYWCWSKRRHLRIRNAGLGRGLWVSWGTPWQSQWEGYRRITNPPLRDGWCFIIIKSMMETDVFSIVFRTIHGMTYKSWNDFQESKVLDPKIRDHRLKSGFVQKHSLPEIE